MSFAAKKSRPSHTFPVYSDAELVQALTLKGAGASQIIEFLYQTVRPILAYNIMSGRDIEEESWDIFQDGLLVLIENLREGKYDQKSKLSTYLLSICKHIWYDKIKHRSMAERQAAFILLESESSAPSILPHLLKGEKCNLVMQLFKRIPEKCRQILRLFYWERFNLESIALRLGYDNAASAKARKYRCQKELMRLLRENPEILILLKDT